MGFPCTSPSTRPRPPPSRSFSQPRLSLFSSSPHPLAGTQRPSTPSRHSPLPYPLGGWPDSPYQPPTLPVVTCSSAFLVTPPLPPHLPVTFWSAPAAGPTLTWSSNLFMDTRATPSSSWRKGRGEQLLPPPISRTGPLSQHTLNIDPCPPQSISASSPRDPPDRPSLVLPFPPAPALSANPSLNPSLSPCPAQYDHRQPYLPPLLLRIEPQSSFVSPDLPTPHGISRPVQRHPDASALLSLLLRIDPPPSPPASSPLAPSLPLVRIDPQSSFVSPNLFFTSTRKVAYFAAAAGIVLR